MLRFPRIAAFALAAGLIASLGAPLGAGAQNTTPVKIVVVTDMSGVYAALAGPGSVASTKMAVADFGGKVLGRPIEVDVIDHRNNATESAAKLREAFDGGADMAIDFTNSGVALAGAAVAKEKHKLVIVTGGATSALTGPQCNRYTYHYAYDTYALAHSTGTNIANQSDGKTWYMLVANYAFGQQMLADFTDAIKNKGGSVVHADMIPLGNTDFSSYELAAKNSKAQVLGFMNAGADTVNSVKQARQFGLDKQMKLAIGLLFLSDVNALPDAFTGARITTSWYWDMDDASRAWAAKFSKQMNGTEPTDVQASNYSATMQWLNAVKAVGTTDADKVQAYLDGRQVNDFYAHGGEIRRPATI